MNGLTNKQFDRQLEDIENKKSKVERERSCHCCPIVCALLPDYRNYHPKIYDEKAVWSSGAFDH